METRKNMASILSGWKNGNGRGGSRRRDREQQRGGNEAHVSTTQLGPTMEHSEGSDGALGTTAEEREIAAVRFTGVFVEFYTMTTT